MLTTKVIWCYMFKSQENYSATIFQLVYD